MDALHRSLESSKQIASTGVIVDAKGFILTNDHVIDQATKIQAMDFAKILMLIVGPFNDD